MANQFSIDADFSGAKGIFNKLLFFKIYVTELAIFFILIIISFRKDKLASCSKLILLPAFIIVWSVQSISFWFSNEFVSLLVLENLRSAQMIMSTTSMLVMFGIFVVAIFLMVGLQQATGLLVKDDHKLKNVLALTVFSLSLYTTDILLSNEHRIELKTIEQKLVNGRDAPIYASFVLFYNYFSPQEHNSEKLTREEHQAVRRYGLRIASNPIYPMSHKKFYNEELPFRKTKALGQPNVIVFFVEALSARKLPIYGSAYAGITPNLDKLAERTLIVDNYFNHTQSTFRGIKGQLCSMFPYHTTRPEEWANKDFKPLLTTYDCLPHHLNKAGYDTIFLGPDSPDHAHFRFQTRSAGFQHNFYREYLNKTYLNNGPLYGPFLTDIQLTNSLNAILDTPVSEKPFFVAGYFKSSHVGQDIKPDGIPYGDGSNQVLNTLHTFDLAFGKFWNVFSKSKHFENTIVIVTGDHTHWPEKAFKEVAGKGFNNHPVDRLSLMIYSPFHEFPERYDVHNATSLGFAPMVTQLLDLPHAENSFIGRSPFESRSEKTSVAWFNLALFPIDEKGKVRLVKLKRDELSSDQAAVWKAISLTHQAEFKNTITRFAGD